MEGSFLHFPSTSPGFYYTPVSKALLGGWIAGWLLVNIPAYYRRPWLNPAAFSVLDTKHVLRSFICRCFFMELKDLIFGCFIMYWFRMFERRYGSHKFANYLLTTFSTSILLEVFVLLLLERSHYTLAAMPTGPYGPLLALYVPFYCDIPRVASSQFFGIPVTGKSIVYLMGLQMVAHSRETLLMAAFGLMSGILNRVNFLYIKKVFQLPRFLAKLCDKTLGRLVYTPAPADLNRPIGATLQLQRLDEMDRRERQQMAWLQAQQQNDRFRRLMAAFGQGQNFGAPQAAATVQEEQVTQLVDMGFQRDRVISALQRCNNNVVDATTLLLQEH